MWPFKKEYLVPIVDCSDRVITAMMRDDERGGLNVFDYLEAKHGIKRKWKNNTMTNYLVFNNEAEYTWFLLKL